MRAKKFFKSVIIYGSLMAILPVLVSCSGQSPTATTDSTPVSGIGTTVLPSVGPAPTGPTVQSFTPAAGSIPVLPTSVQVIFSETTMDPTTTQNSANWSITCGSQAAVAPTSVSLSNGTATITLPSTIPLSQGISCTLQASPSIVDTSGLALTGTTSAVYQIGSSTTAPFTAQFTTLRNQDRISGTVNLGVTVFPTGTNGPTLSSIQFVLNTLGGNVILGNGAVDANGNYNYSWNTTSFPQDGPSYSVNVTGVDTNGVQYPNIATPLAVNIQNHNSLTSLPLNGGTSETAFSEAAPSGQVLFGVRVTYGSSYEGVGSTYVYSLQPIWRQAYGLSTTLTYGGIYGSASGTTYDLVCPAPVNSGPSYAVSGFTGTSGTYIDSLGILCRQEYDFGNPVTVSPVGGTTIGTTFSSECASDTFLTAFSGSSGTWYSSYYIDNLQGSCQ